MKEAPAAAKSQSGKTNILVRFRERTTLGLVTFRGTRAKWVAISSFISSALLYWLAIATGDIRVETAQSNGLAEVQYPYSGASLLATLAALGVCSLTSPYRLQFSGGEP